MNRTLIGPKKQGETVFCPPQGFDFTPLLAAGETISSASFFVGVYTGVDSNPSAMLSGSPIVNGPVVLQLFAGGQLGTVYTIHCSIVTSLGQMATLIGYLYVFGGEI